MSERLTIGEDVLAAHDAVAAANRRRFADDGVLVVNLLSGPGSGKTALLCRLLERLVGALPVAVVEGDQRTQRDAARVRAAGASVVQIETGKGCHLEAPAVRDALDHLEVPRGGILFVENVGNLVCPAGFDLGEDARVVLAAVTEGEDKPLKYPHLFRTADLVIVHKIDLAEVLEADVPRLRANALALAPSATVLEVSSKDGTGLDAVEAWLRERWEAKRAAEGPAARGR